MRLSRTWILDYGLWQERCLSSKIYNLKSIIFPSKLQSKE